MGIDPSMFVATRLKRLFPELIQVEFEWYGDNRHEAEVLPVGVDMTDEQKQEALTAWLSIDDDDVRKQELGESHYLSGIYLKPNA